MNSQPLFILGSPRSGTTFLCFALNQHPLIRLTNESRVFVLLKDLVEERCLRPDLLEPEYRDRFQHFIQQHAGAWVEQFYRESLGSATPIWGDKHTSYGDPAVLSGREGAAMVEPRSGSCLRLIRSCLPHAKFIHLHRHPWQVAASMKRRGWVESIEAGVQVWKQHVLEIEAFFAELAESSRLTLSFTELVEHPDMVASDLGGFLGLGDAAPIRRFLAGQRVQRTPFSSPTSDLRRPLALQMPAEWDCVAMEKTAEEETAIAMRLGYDLITLDDS